MDGSSGNKGFVTKGSSIIVMVAAIILIIWFIVRKANSDAALHKTKDKDSTEIQNGNSSAQPANTDTAGGQTAPADTTQKQ